MTQQPQFDVYHSDSSQYFKVEVSENIILVDVPQ